jgi:CHC2-type zinc finger protein
MCPLQNPTGPVSFSEIVLGDRNAGNDTKIFEVANSINILSILERFKTQIDYSGKCKCPFPFHKNGNERTASFSYNEEKNMFYCFGCKSGGGPVNFVSLMQDVSKLDAARFILNNFKDAAKIKFVVDDQYQEKINQNLQFALLIRNFISSNRDDTNAIKHAESITEIYDELNHKHNLNVDGLKLIIEKLKVKLEDYNGSNINIT